MNLEEFKEKLLERGATKGHLNSKVLPIALEVLAEEVSPEEALKCLQSIRDNNLEKFKSEQWLFENEKTEVRNKKHDLEVKRAELEEEKKALEQMKKELNESLAMETAEMRDKSRAAIMYEKMTRPDGMNMYQYTEYIKGLGKILGERQNETAD